MHLLSEVNQTHESFHKCDIIRTVILYWVYSVECTPLITKENKLQKCIFCLAMSWECQLYDKTVLESRILKVVIHWIYFCIRADVSNYFKTAVVLSDLRNSSYSE